VRPCVHAAACADASGGRGAPGWSIGWQEGRRGRRSSRGQRMTRGGGDVWRGPARGRGRMEARAGGPQCRAGCLGGLSARAQWCNGRITSFLGWSGAAGAAEARARAR
jgi:hypothetical protein